MRAVVVRDKALVLGDVEEPVPSRDEALVEVRALSLNRGELRMAASKPDGARIGWDVAGVVTRAAADGSGPPVGARVAAFLHRADAWAERIAAPTRALAVIPDGVSDEVAAALPVAGLTALRGLDKGVRVTGRRVAITGATGGVGGFAVQIARAMGACVVAQVRRREQIAQVKALGAHEIVVSEDASGMVQHGPYAVVFDGLGGEAMRNLVKTLDRDGVLVTYGGTAGYTTEFGVFELPRRGSIYGFSLYQETDEEAGGVSLRRLLAMVERGLIEVEIGHRGSWEDIGEAAQALLDRAYSGKGVLTVRGA
ncbi:MAG: zinc-binding dehydrogenase [Myxococcota bacterium]